MTDLDGLGYRGATVVVVGCASGIGAATAQTLGDLGAQVHAVSLHEPTVHHESFHQTDLSDIDQIEGTARALRTIGPIDHLFCASGVPVTRDALHVVRVNYVGVRHMVEQTVPSMRDGGAIGLVASNVAHDWEARLPVLADVVGIEDPNTAIQWLEDHTDVVADGYRIAKQLLVAWVASWAPSLATTRGIRVNCTAPGPTATPLITETTPYVGEGFFDTYPYPVLGRIASAVEQAWPLVLLNSRLNAVATGSLLYTDQGVTGGTVTGALAPLH